MALPLHLQSVACHPRPNRRSWIAVKLLLDMGRSTISRKSARTRGGYQERHLSTSSRPSRCNERSAAGDMRIIPSCVWGAAPADSGPVRLGAWVDDAGRSFVECLAEIRIRHVAAQHFHILMRRMCHGVSQGAGRVRKNLGEFLEPDNPAGDRFRLGSEWDRVSSGRSIAGAARRGAGNRRQAVEVDLAPRFGERSR